MTKAIEPSAREMVEQLRRDNLHLQLGWAVSAKGDAIGLYSENDSRYVPVVVWAITGEWVRMPYEILLNGERPRWDWQPVCDAVVSR